MPRLRAWLVVLAGVAAVTGCTTGPPPAPATSVNTPSPAAPAPPVPRTALPAAETTVLAGASAVDLALAISGALYHDAPAVVLTAEADAAGMPGAISTAVDLGVPLLLVPAADPVPAARVRDELRRLAPSTIVTMGDEAAQWLAAAPTATPSAATPTAPTGTPPVIVHAGAGEVALPTVEPAAPLDQLLVLALDQPASQAAVATARASGARVVTLTNPDPRVDGRDIAALTGQPTARVLALGSAFGPADRLRTRVDTAATGVLLPGGGQVLFPGRRMVALYGHPGDSGLGALGEQSVGAAITRVKKVAASYAALVREPVVPTFEIIATVASSSAGADGDYSLESPLSLLRPWVQAARDAGVYVVLDLQPGRTDFLTQARRYADLLRYPNVGLALDPEWRLKPNQFHMRQIGSVPASEINQTGAWLDELTRMYKLPQKVLLVHQFRLDMISNRSSVVTDYDELKVVIHVDGFGTAGQKFNTWNALHVNPPANVWWGWKNFYDEDRPTFTPRQTVAVKPSPIFVSYQ